MDCVLIYENGQVMGEQAAGGARSVIFDFPAGRRACFGKKYEAEAVFSGGLGRFRITVPYYSLYGTAAFDGEFFFGGELGALFGDSQTVFRVWSPVSERISLNIYGSGDGGEPEGVYEMKKGAKGVFEYALAGAWGGKYYTYTVYNFKYPDGAEIADPYARSAGLNGRRGMITDMRAAEPEGWGSVRPVPYDRRELVIYETHVADVTSSPTWTGTERFRRRFPGMWESGTAYTENGITVKTGFDHIRELGVNAVQLMPVADQVNDEGSPEFNWGYNPLNYNVPEGGYSTDPRDGYVRIREFRELVAAYAKAGINIIMDVVYNHVYLAEGSNFDVLMPGYFFRHTAGGALSDGSGCGCETASERPMFRKFIIDSAVFWAGEYRLGGFRFDLMGLHDTETMNLLAEKLREVNPSIVLFGEPWAGGASALDEDLRAVQRNARRLKGVGQFNDRMRDALIRGGMNPVWSRGWATDPDRADPADAETLMRGLAGETFAGGAAAAGPEQTVNYVTSHDNLTLYDRIKAAGIGGEETVGRMAVLANAAVLTSDGTAFMLSGEEMLRTKGGDANSYRSGWAVNALDYSLKIRHPGVFASYRRLISFKKAYLSLLSRAGAPRRTKALAGGAAVLVEFTCADGTRRRVVQIGRAHV